MVHCSRRSLKRFLLLKRLCDHYWILGLNKAVNSRLHSNAPGHDPLITLAHERCEVLNCLIFRKSEQQQIETLLKPKTLRFLKPCGKP